MTQYSLSGHLMDHAVSCNSLWRLQALSQRLQHRAPCIRDALGKLVGSSGIPCSFSPGKLSRKRAADAGAGKGG